MIWKMLLLMWTMTVTVLADHWKTDPSTAKITFQVGGPFGTVDGEFTGLETEIQFSESDLAGSSIVASVDASTVSTGVGLRNRDLRKKEIWLNTSKYPRISFRSTKIEKDGNAYKAIGILKLKDVSKTISIPFTFTSKNNEGIFKGKFSINREDYHVGKEGGSVDNRIDLTLEVPVTKN